MSPYGSHQDSDEACPYHPLPEEIADLPDKLPDYVLNSVSDVQEYLESLLSDTVVST